MADTTHYNLATFVIGDVRLPLQLDNGFELTPGIAPNINTAVVSWSDYDRLASLPQPWTGEVHLQYSAGTTTPNVAIKQITVVNVQEESWGRQGPALTWRVLTYRLCLADARQRLMLPRGGVVNGGEINKSPIDDEGNDANGRPVQTARQLVDKCLAAMGLTATLPEEFEDGPVLEDLNWRASHAPTELARILDQLGYIFHVKLDGTFAISRIGSGPEVSIPDFNRMASFELPGVDRRGKNVLFTSAPNGLIVTQQLVGPGPVPGQGSGPPHLMFVVYLPRHGWVTLEEATVLIGRGQTFFDHYKQGFANLEPYVLFPPGGGSKHVDLRDQLRLQAYRCIRVALPPDHPGESILRKLNLAGKAHRDPQVRAKIAIRAPGGGWTNASDLVDCTIEGIIDGQVLVVSQRLLKLAPGSAISYSPDADAAELAPGELEVAISWELVDAETHEPKYWEIGYTLDATGQLVELYPPPDSLRIDPNTLIINEPRWILVREVVQADGQMTIHEPMLEKMKEVARYHAHRYLAKSDAPARRHLARGFVPIDLDGRVSRVHYSQRNMTTTIDEFTWWMPHHMDVLRPNDGRYRGMSLRLREVHTPYRQSETQARRRAANTADQIQPMVPVFPGRPIDRGGEAGLLVVDLASTSGTGTVADPYVYSAWSEGADQMTATPLGTGLSPLKPRLPVDVSAAATKGLAYYDHTGTFQLIEAFETFANEEACPEEETP